MLIGIAHTTGGEHLAHSNHMTASLLKFPVELNRTAES